MNILYEAIWIIWAILTITSLLINIDPLQLILQMTYVAHMCCSVQINSLIESPKRAYSPAHNESRFCRTKKN